MGNPPFQGTGRKKIYIDFIQNMLDSKIKQDGYFLFITPKLTLQYLLGGDVLQKTLSQLYNILYINTSETIKSTYFNGIGSDFMYFILKNNTDYDKTTFIFDDGTVDDNYKLSYKSLVDTKTHNEMSNRILGKLIELNSNQWRRKAARISEGLEEEKKDTHQNKIVYKILTNEDDDVIKWTNKTHEDMNKFKIMYPTVGKRIIIDENRELFPGTSFVVYITCESLVECKNIEKLMNSNLFKYLENIFSTHRSPRDYIMRNLIKPNGFGNKIDDFYTLFNLKSEEKNYIEKVVKTKESEKTLKRIEKDVEKTKRDQEKADKKRATQEDRTQKKREKAENTRKKKRSLTPIKSPSSPFGSSPSVSSSPFGSSPFGSSPFGSSPSVSSSPSVPSTKKKRCGKGTRKNKETGKCVTIKKTKKRSV